MKLKLEDKLKIIKLYKTGKSSKQIVEIFNVNICTIQVIERLYNLHGLDVFTERNKPDTSVQVLN
ncbi:hypothetical protein CO229_00620 [Mycoplasmopsis bovirhinis]|uniref:helix-turn-helix domain-containing protein n=1 Tax=Mycoplasmopsis bovirhinis TaxID=29553 RepID=UPI000C05A709|nr:hypothetical protein CO229_00620 [Mycoplasmopsis bovirhinis]